MLPLVLSADINESTISTPSWLKFFWKPQAIFDLHKYIICFVNGKSEIWI